MHLMLQSDLESLYAKLFLCMIHLNPRYIAVAGLHYFIKVFVLNFLKPYLLFKLLSKTSAPNLSSWLVSVWIFGGATAGSHVIRLIVCWFAICSLPSRDERISRCLLINYYYYWTNLEGFAYFPVCSFVLKCVLFS